MAGTSHNSAGTFYVWDGRRWSLDHGQVKGWAAETARGLGFLVEQAVKSGATPEATKAVVKFWAASESDGAIDSIISLIRPMVAVDPASFDANPMLLGVQNGVVDLETGELKEADRAQLITKLCNATFNPDAACPKWEEFLLAACGGDTELVRYLRQCAGICLTGLTEEHTFFIVTGPGGTGKTTFQEALKFVWNDYAIGIDPNSLASSKNEGARARPDLAKLPGIRLAFANESRAGLRIDEGLLKALTGNDTMTARELYRAEFDFIPTHKLWLRTNHAPQFDGGDTGMRRRVRLIPFTQVVHPSAKDGKLRAKLQKEADGILLWALRGLADYQQNGLVEPKAVLEATEAYVDSLDTVAQFIAERCILKPTADQPAGDLYAAYKNWVEARNQRAFSLVRFGADLDGRGFRQRTLAGRKLWVGIMLKQAAHPGKVVLADTIDDADLPDFA